MRARTGTLRFWNPSARRRRRVFAHRGAGENKINRVDSYDVGRPEDLDVDLLLPSKLDVLPGPRFAQFFHVGEQIDPIGERPDIREQLAESRRGIERRLGLGWNNGRKQEGHRNKRAIEPHGNPPTPEMT